MSNVIYLPDPNNDFDYTRKYSVVVIAIPQTLQNTRSNFNPLLFVVLAPAADPVDVDVLVVEWPPPVADELSVEDGPPLTIPALVKANPEISTKVYGLSASVSVETCLCPNTARFSACPIDVKQNSPEFNGVVAHPPGQHTLLVPLTENVV